LNDNRQAGLPFNTIDIIHNGIDNGRTVMSCDHLVGNAPESMTTNTNHTVLACSHESEVSIMEIWSVNEKHRLTCHMDASSSTDADNKMIELDKKYPGRLFIICPPLTGRRVINGKVTRDGVYGS